MSKRILAAILLFCLLAQPAQAQDGFTTYFPIITKGNGCELMSDPILRVTDGTKVIDLLGPGSGWELSDPYWQPQIAQFKGGGAFVDSGLAEGKQLVHKEYDNVVESIPLSVTGIDQGAAIQTIRDLLQLGRQSSDYWTEIYEYDDVWLEVKPACANSLTGYSRIIKMSIPNLNNIFGQPFFSAYTQPVMEDLTLIIEREPFWRGTPPGEMIGPLYNLIKNPDFELWNFGTGDSQPDNWTDLESLWITGQNGRDDKPQWGNYALKVRVSGSTKAGAVKGITQVLDGIIGGKTYTVIAWVRSEGVSNGVGRILITYSSQLELYRSSDQHGWTLYTGTITTGVNDVVSINCEILTTAVNTDGTVYFDGLMFIEGDWIEEAENGTLPYLSSSHIVNHWDKLGGIIVAGEINFVDAWNVPGDIDALTKLELYNETIPADYTHPIESYETIRIGQRRIGNIFNFDNFVDPIGTIDSTASGGYRLNSQSLNNQWQQIISKVIAGSDTVFDNQGRFRVFARTYDPKASGIPTLQARIRYFVGTAGIGEKVLDSVTQPVLGQWSILNLTPTRAMIQQRQHSTVPLGQIGYILDMKRETGTDIGRLDYILTMPTDGGYLEATINPAITPGNMLVVDNTSSQTISGTNRLAGKWITRFDTGQLQVTDIKDFQGNVYFATSGGVYQLKNETFTQVLTISPIGGAGFARLEIYKGELYCSIPRNTGGGTGPLELYASPNGINWRFVATIASVAIGVGGSKGLTAFRDKLFIMYDGAGVDARIYIFDGSSVSLNYSYTGPPAERPSNFEIIGNNLYTKIEDYLLRYNVSLNNWDFILDTGFATSCIRNFNENLIMEKQGGAIYKYDGGSLSLLGSASSVFTTYFQTMAVYNGKLFAGGNDTGVTEALVFSEDGINWQKAGLNTETVEAIGVYNGVLYIGERDTGNAAKIYSYSDTDNSYSTTDYKGIPFTSPPKKRHRYFFLYDRENYINNIDDKALIGIGFVPRYLSLINYNPQ